jgi:hypothetical protein
MAELCKLHKDYGLEDESLVISQKPRLMDLRPFLFSLILCESQYRKLNTEES